MVIYLAKVKCKLVSIYAQRSDSKAILRRLQEMSVMDIETAASDEETSALPEGYDRSDTEYKAAAYERDAVSAENALKILNERFPEKKGLKQMFSGPRTVSADEFYMKRDEIKAALSDINDIINYDRGIAEASAEKVRLNTTMEQMLPWQALDVPLSFSGTVKTAAFIGTVAGNYSLEALLSEIAIRAPQAEVYGEIVFSAKDSTYIFVCCPKQQRQEVENALRELSFARPAQTTSKLPRDKIASKASRIAECDRRTQEYINKMGELSKKRKDIELFADFCRTGAERHRAMGEIMHTEHTLLITGYVAEPDVDFLEKTLKKDFCVVIESEDTNEELAPVKLKNNAFASPAETVTQMYSLPSSRDIDPTILTGFFYYLLFGMMLSDAGYGLLMVIGTLIVLKKFNPSPKMRKTMKLFLYCGISTCMWGLIFGSFFGDSIAVISGTFFGREVSLPALIDPMNGGALTLLILSLAIGFVQIIAGLTAKFVTCMKNGDKAGAFFDAGLWITTLTGIAVLAVGVMAVPMLKTVGAVIAIVSVIGLILTQGRDKKNPVMRLISGITSLYDITGYVSDLLSFSRLMALGLTTAAMGAVFNMLGTLGGKSVTGVILMLIIFPVGHAISFALNALGAYVHTLRLQYVELFSKFYDGGGREFKAFSIKNKYVGVTNADKEEL